MSGGKRCIATTDVDGIRAGVEDGLGARAPVRDILVVGAGIAGLATAITLARRGFGVTVLERAVALTEVGAGIQLGPNGMAVLDALGISQEVRAAGLRGEAVELRRAEDDALVAHMPLGDRDWVLIHRARLLEVLAQAAIEAGARILTACEVVTVIDGADRAELTTADGTHHAADLIVGADGLRGGVREALGSVEAAAFAGHVAWRALIPGGGPAVSEVHMAGGRHLVTYPLAGGLRNIVAVEARRQWAEEGWSIPGDPAVLRSRFGEMSPRIGRLLAEVAEVHVWGLHRHPVARIWHGRRVALVGDTVHPTLPFLAQGANLGLEDAWALADCIANLSLGDALPAYQARRRARAARIVAAGGQNAWVYHMWRGPQRRVLHAGIGLMERLRPGGAISRFDWIYRHDETRVPSG